MHFCRLWSLYHCSHVKKFGHSWMGWGQGSEPSEKSSHRRPANEIPFQWRFSGGPMVAHLELGKDPLAPSVKYYN